MYLMTCYGSTDRARGRQRLERHAYKARGPATRVGSTSSGGDLNRRLRTYRRRMLNLPRVLSGRGGSRNSLPTSLVGLNDARTPRTCANQSVSFGT